MSPQYSQIDKVDNVCLCMDKYIIPKLKLKKKQSLNVNLIIASSPIWVHHSARPYHGLLHMNTFIQTPSLLQNVHGVKTIIAPISTCHAQNRARFR